MADDSTNAEQQNNQESLTESLEAFEDQISELSNIILSDDNSLDEEDNVKTEDVKHEAKEENHEEENKEEYEQQVVDNNQKFVFLQNVGFSADRAQQLIEAGLADAVLQTFSEWYEYLNSTTNDEVEETKTENTRQENVKVQDTGAPELDIELPPELLTDEYDGALRDGLLAIKDWVKKHIQTLSAKVDSVVQHADIVRQAAEQQQATAIAQAFDKLITNTIDRPDLFGEGQNMTQDQIANRMRLASAMQEIVKGRQQTGRDVPPPDKLMRMAFHAEFGDHIEETTRQQISNKIQRRAPIHKPTHRHSSAPTPNLAALLDKEKDAFL